MTCKDRNISYFEWNRHDIFRLHRRVIGRLLWKKLSMFSGWPVCTLTYSRILDVLVLLSPDVTVFHISVWVIVPTSWEWDHIVIADGTCGMSVNCHIHFTLLAKTIGENEDDSKAPHHWLLQCNWYRAPRACYQIRKIAWCACAGNDGSVFPATDFKGNR